MSQVLNIADFQTELDGRKTDLFFLENNHGVRAAVTNYGARLVAIWTPDINGEPDNIVACYDTLAGYLNHDEAYLGAMVGRYANRIKDASFKLGGRNYRVRANEGKHHIHGGEKGFHNSVWQAEQVENNSLNLKLWSEDGKEGFPGNLEVNVRYTFTGEDELIVETEATSDRDTVINITNHSYFNLSGESECTPARRHQLMIDADSYLAVDEDKIPFDNQESVDHSPFDFRTSRIIEQQIDLDSDHRQIEIGEGYDHNFVLNKSSDSAFEFAAAVKDTFSGRVMELRTSEPGLQFFECEFPYEMELNLDSAFCLEPQHFPDSPNRSHFPSTVLRAGERFYSKSTYSFSNKA